MKISLVNLLNEGRKSISVLKPLAHSISQAFTQPNIWPDVDKVASIIIDLIEGEDVEDTPSEDLYAMIDLEEVIPSNEFERLKSLTDDKNMVSFLNALQTGVVKVSFVVDVLDPHISEGYKALSAKDSLSYIITVPQKGIIDIVDDHHLLHNGVEQYKTSREFLNTIILSSTFENIIIHELYHVFQTYNTWYKNKMISPHFKKLGVGSLLKSLDSNPSLTPKQKDRVKYLLQDEEVWARIQEAVNEVIIPWFEQSNPEDLLQGGVQYFKRRADRFVHRVLYTTEILSKGYFLPAQARQYLTVIYFQLLSHQFDQLKKQYPDLAKKALLKLRPNLP